MECSRLLGQAELDDLIEQINSAPTVEYALHYAYWHRKLAALGDTTFPARIQATVQAFQHAASRS
jgi:hypothetical protein